MRSQWRRGGLASYAITALLFGAAAVGWSQQVVVRGAFGRPAQVLDETGQWTTPLEVASDHEVSIYMADVSSPTWLQANYDAFEGRGQYVLTILTFYKTPKACRANQIGWGYGDAAHLDACVSIGYRVRQATVDVNLKTVTLIQAEMVGQDGTVVDGSVERQPLTRRWAELDGNSQTALDVATKLVTKQMDAYDRRLRSLH